MRASVVGGVNASPVLEAPKNIFDFVPLAIEVLVMFNVFLAIDPL